MERAEADRKRAAGEEQRRRDEEEGRQKEEEEERTRRRRRKEEEEESGGRKISEELQGDDGLYLSEEVSLRHPRDNLAGYAFFFVLFNVCACTLW